MCKACGSITDLLKWFLTINLFIFLSESLAIRFQVSGFRCQVSGVRNELAET
jgi:hypothetical protein